MSEQPTAPQQPRTAAEVRRALADARIQRDLGEENLKIARAYAEQRAIAAVGDEKALGVNAEARARALTIALDQDEEWQSPFELAQDLRAHVERLQAELDTLIDERRERYRLTLDRLAAAVEAWAGAPAFGETWADESRIASHAVDAVVDAAVHEAAGPER